MYKNLMRPKGFYVERAFLIRVERWLIEAGHIEQNKGEIVLMGKTGSLVSVESLVVRFEPCSSQQETRQMVPAG